MRPSPSQPFAQTHPQRLAEQRRQRLAEPQVQRFAGPRQGVLGRIARGSAAALLAAGALASGSTAHAAQHLFHIGEVFTSADGKVQFIELVGEADAQVRFNGMSLCAGDPAIAPGQPGRQCFLFTMDLPDLQTRNKSLLFASRGYLDLAQAQGLPAPDFVLEGPSIDPAQPFFKPGGDQIDFLPQDTRTDIVIFPAFPQDGVTSFNGPFTTRTNAAMQRPTNLGMAKNSPTNFAGMTGSVNASGAALVQAPLDADLDGVSNALDLCPSVADPAQLDRDGDRVGDACDNCVLAFNPALAPSAGQSTTGGQIDDDADGFGNECDADFSADGRSDAADLALFMSALGKPALSRECGLAGGESCAPYDVVPGSARIDAGDLQALEPLLGRAPGPKCEACPLECAGPACAR